MNLNGAFFRYFIRYLTCREKIESKESKWCILTLFYTYARRFLGSVRAPGSDCVTFNCYCKFGRFIFLIFFT